MSAKTKGGLSGMETLVRAYWGFERIAEEGEGKEHASTALRSHAAGCDGGDENADGTPKTTDAKKASAKLKKWRRIRKRVPRKSKKHHPGRTTEPEQGKPVDARHEVRGRGYLIHTHTHSVCIHGLPRVCR